ncbi:hypothetical protein [Nocardioides sp.]|uniref:hypothetical protein n=1 Tax=Nocardioides sp. TaxID=35761 RepID=UPI002ED8C1FE
MRATLGIVVASLVLAGCGDAQPRAAEPEPTPPAPSSSASESPSPSTSDRVIPEGFPLLNGFPDDRQAEPGQGRRGPSRAMEPLVPEACGESVPLPAHTDLLRAAWTNPEDDRERQLVTFATVEEAQAYAEQVLTLFRACPEETTSEETEETRHVSVHDSHLGDFAGAASTLYRMYGFRAPGLTTWYVVRVGAAVLLTVTYNEGGAGADPDQQAADQRARDARAITGVVEAMATIENYPSEPPFGPEGFGPVRLGMSRDELLALPGVRITGGNGVCEDFEAGGVIGHLQPALGVAVLSIHADLETPERIHEGSTLAELRAAYPRGTYDDPWYSVALTRYGDRSYRFELHPDGHVIGVMLLLDAQHCGG